MEKYLKMSDFFKGQEVQLPESWSHEMVTHAAHAINSHDELVAEADRLRYENSILRTKLENSERLNRELLIEQ